MNFFFLFNDKVYASNYINNFFKVSLNEDKDIDNEGERRVMGGNGRLGFTHTVLMKSES